MICVPAAFKLVELISPLDGRAEIFTVLQPVKSSNRVLCVRYVEEPNGQNTFLLPSITHVLMMSMAGCRVRENE